MNTYNGTTYKTATFEVKGDRWLIGQVSGRFNYVSVLKITNNPFGTLGKEFKNFEAAAAHYKSPEMKTALLMAELDLAQSQ